MEGQHNPVFFKTFPVGTDEEKRRFDLLRQAYVGARYHDEYKITPQELKYLSRCVELLRVYCFRCNWTFPEFLLIS
jgi:hypothetical protein